VIESFAERAIASIVATCAGYVFAAANGAGQRGAAATGFVCGAVAFTVATFADVRADLDELEERIASVSERAWKARDELDELRARLNPVPAATAPAPA
jgi:hypothetical protein